MTKLRGGRGSFSLASPVMLVFIFPKNFELFKFLTYLLKAPDIIVLSMRQVDLLEYVVDIVRFPGADILQAGVTHGDLNLLRKFYYRFRLLLIDDSDINFYGIFSKLAQEETSATCYMLLGSCGSARSRDLAKSFIVTNAVKGDRGRLDERGVFRFDAAKRSVRTHQLWGADLQALTEHGIESRKACSTNFLNMNIIAEEFKDHVFDMETYDFYDICSKQGIKMFSCVRFVTDCVLPLNTSTPTVEGYVKSLPRAALHDCLTTEASSLILELINTTAKHHTVTAAFTRQAVGILQQAISKHNRDFIQAAAELQEIERLFVAGVQATVHKRATDALEKEFGASVHATSNEDSAGDPARPKSAHSHYKTHEPLEEVKKFIRLRLEINFDFIFKLNLHGNMQPEGAILADRMSVAKYYSYFREKFVAKVREVAEGYDSLPAAAEANEKKLALMQS